jgi:hypothetical protein
MDVPNYYVKLRGVGAFPNDPDPEFYPDLDAARTGALESIRGMASESMLTGPPCDVEAIDITTEAGGVLLTVPVSGVIANGKSYPALT